jgi:hypothetical protein
MLLSNIIMYEFLSRDCSFSMCVLLSERFNMVSLSWFFSLLVTLKMIKMGYLISEAKFLDILNVRY